MHSDSMREGVGGNDNVRGLMHSEQAQQRIHGSRDAMV